jgi:TonB family protein
MNQLESYEYVSCLTTGGGRGRSFVVSYVFQAIALTALLYIGATQRANITAPAPYQVTDLLTPVYVQPKPKLTTPIKMPAPEVAQQPEPTATPTVTLTPPIKAEVKSPVPVPPQVTPQPTAVPQFAAARVAVASASVPREPVKVGGFSGTPAASTTVSAAANKVQTGGFGDPNGVPSRNDSHGPANIARLGSFDLPAGPGNGNGTGGASGIAGRVTTGGFGDGVGAGGNGRGSGGTAGAIAGVRQGGFADGTAHVQNVSQPARIAAPQETPVEVLSKPNPVYTAEARQQKVEGEVVLEVEFGASGTLQIVRVVRGLGHGLDESAIAAARQIRFKPATRDGLAVSSTGKLHILFQLA